MDIVVRAGVADDGDDRSPRLARQLAGGRLQGLRVPGHDRNPRTLARQLPGHGLANAPTASGHDGALVLQLQVHPGSVNT